MNFKRLLPIYLGAAIGPIAGGGMITILPVLAKTWDISIQWVTLAVTIYMIPYVVFQLFSGSVAHVFNPRRTLLFGLGVYALGGLLCGFSSSMGTLLGARFIQGFGAAFVGPIVMAMVGEIAAEKHVGKAMGLLGVMYTVGMTMGPLISGVLEVYLGWPWFFFFLTGLSLLVGILFWITSLPGEKSATGGAKLLDAFPLLRQAYSYRDVRFLSFAAFCFFLAYIGLMTFMADYLKTHFALSSDRVGLTLSMAGFAGIIASPIAGILGDRFGRKYVAYAGGGIMVAAVTVMEAIEFTQGKYLVLFALLGTGSSFVWISLNTLAVTIVPDLRKPVASVYNCLKFSGYALAPVALSRLYLPFSISGVLWACIISIFGGLFLASRLRLGMKNSGN